MRGLDAYAVLDGTTWGALALVLTVIGGALSWRAFQRRGLASGLRGLAWTLLPLAAWLTGTLKLAARIVEDVSRWAVHLVFSPVVWLGVGVAGVSAALFVASGFLRARGLGRTSARPEVSTGSTSGGRLPSGGRPTGGVSTGSTSGGRRGRSDDDIEGLDEIEAILKKHGI